MAYKSEKLRKRFRILIERRRNFRNRRRCRKNLIKTIWMIQN